MVNRQFWQGKKVFLTGHTGFKGGWMAAWLHSLNADVTGYSLAPNTDPSFFEICRIGSRIDSHIGDIRDREGVARAVAAAQPEIVFHMAAQPIVRRSYVEPVETMATNIMGTVHVLEAVRQSPGVRAVIVVTSDKCYDNRGLLRGYREDEAMGGRDPYSASKGCTELVAASYQHSFFRNGGLTVATARAGNVIGGGDWADDRIMPDAIRALGCGRPFGVRNPSSVRPWQHVLEPVCGYLMLAERVFTEQRVWEGGWNFGPSDDDAVPVSTLSDLIVQSWGEGAGWQNLSQADAPHEESYLKLDSNKARQRLGWQPRLNVADTVRWTIDWYRKALASNSDDAMFDFTNEQLARYDALG